MGTLEDPARLKKAVVDFFVFTPRALFAGIFSRKANPQGWFGEQPTSFSTFVFAVANLESQIEIDCNISMIFCSQAFEQYSRAEAIEKSELHSDFSKPTRRTA